jgi:hypothetical protein
LEQIDLIAPLPSTRCCAAIPSKSVHFRDFALAGCANDGSTTKQSLETVVRELSARGDNRLFASICNALGGLNTTAFRTRTRNHCFRLQ